MIMKREWMPEGAEFHLVRMSKEIIHTLSVPDYAICKEATDEEIWKVVYDMAHFDAEQGTKDLKSKFILLRRGELNE